MSRTKTLRGNLSVTQGGAAPKDREWARIAMGLDDQGVYWELLARGADGTFYLTRRGLPLRSVSAADLAAAILSATLPTKDV